MCVQSAARIAAVYKGEHDGIEHPGYSSIKMTAVLVGNFEKNPQKVPESRLVGVAQIKFHP